MTMAPEDKRGLRIRMRALRQEYALAHADAHPVLPAFLHAHIAAGSVVASYIPVRNEADPMPLAMAAVAMGARLALPHCIDRATPLRFLAWALGDPLEQNALGLSQPRDDAPELAPDIILTPLLAFDATLHRLGQGGGHYDRAFARYQDALRIGIAWSVQQVPAVPVEPWDMPLHAVVTERGAIYHPIP